MEARELTEEQRDAVLEMAATGSGFDDIHRFLKCSACWFLRYRKHHQEFAREFEAAQEQGIHRLVDSTLTIHLEEPDVPRGQLYSRNVQWAASKRIPKVYGDKLAVEQQVTIDVMPVIERARARAASGYGATQLLPRKDRDIVDADYEPLRELTAPDTKSGASADEPEPAPGEGDIYE